MSDKLLASVKSIELETKTSDLIKTCRDILLSLKNNTIDVRKVIIKLSEFILNFSDAVLFKKYLSNILLALVSTRIPLQSVFSNINYDQCSDLEKTKHLEYSIVLALMSDHPDILQYTLKYFQINAIPPYEVFIHHEDAYNVAPKKRRLLDCRQKITDHHIVSCCYTLLSKLPNELVTKWDWTKFVLNFNNHEDTGIRWMVKECMVILTNMTEAQSKMLSNNLCLTQVDQFKNISPPNEIHIIDGNVNELDINVDTIVNIDGILLPIYDKNNVQAGGLVPVKSTINNLRSLALAVASGKAMSLMGPVGSGKTCLVEHLAAITGRKGTAFKKVQLGDQTDSRMLLGSHQCTDAPGEFIWAPGVLTEAVQNGHWLLLEDIDCAALDVASTLSSLLERNTLCVPGYRDALPITPGFQLFVTQRTVVTNYGFQKKLSNSSTLMQKHLTQINVEPLSRSELAEIIQTKYPSLTSICSRMIEVFMMFSVGSHDTSLQTTDITDKDSNIVLMRGSRLISTRDLMKWCTRAVVGFDVTSPESALKVLQDALDIFTCSIALPEYRLELAKKVGTCLGIVETKSEFYCKHYKPNVSLHPNSLEVGRARVPRVEKSLDRIDFDNKEVVFSFTRQSACLLEKIACCVTSNEPVLLVGETGTGKTSSVQYLAKQTGHKLIVINMNQQSDSADLLGGYKPVDLKYVIRPIKTEYIEMFKSFYNVVKNKKFIGHIETCYDTENWTALLALMKQSHKAAITRLVNEKKEDKLKVWIAFGHKIAKLDQQVKAASRLTFAFIEGSLVKAMQQGHWVLLDEINLASAEILECLAGLLEDKNESIDLLEKGDKVPIKRHPDFTLFACMNPATDVGKKDLPVGLRNRFTEFFIDELTERNDLMLLIGDYLYHMNLSGAILEAIYKFYATIRSEAKLNLVDGAGNSPHYSLRTLCRALTAAAKARCGTVARSLYESFCLSFLTQLDRSSHPKVESMIAKAVMGKKNVNSVLKQLIPEPNNENQNFLLFEGHWIPQGKLEIDIPEGYILTHTVRKNLRDIARIISLDKLPVLLQGDTSVGKTSLITYIAKASGNYCVRINNHEHTDLQEYIGSYATDSSGNLVFKEGVLVEAMRKGYWIILDELNLAPSDVLEALNRVLDDNRELFIPETQQVVKADPNFMLFATQNPPGLYGGRKMLSRAFRNRFVELHFDEIPRNELETILHQRCHIPPTYCKKMIDVMAELQVRRRGSAAVQGKDGFITLRDLFRWGQRYKCASKEILTAEKFYDWDQHIADEGYLILGGKVRQTNERNIIEEVIEKHIKRKVNPDNLFSLHANTSRVTRPILELILNNQLPEFSHVVWTYNMRRLAVLIAKAFAFYEPVLLVGETGCGKTTICQVLAALSQRQLLSVNCHMHTESSDFLGGLRPVRQYKNDGRLFEWVDGPLIKSMENGHLFLADEISLADDSVLERLNSLLEPERQLVLSERGMENNSDIVVITAVEKFHFIATMNPGGDFGKKELSPALRNRFTEIWCDHVSSKTDLLNVLEKSVGKGIALGNQEDGTSGIGNCILDFIDWLKKSEVTNKFPFSIRDLLSWVNFVNITVSKGLLDVSEAYVHGACMTFLDCFGTALTGHIDNETLILLRQNAVKLLLNQIKTFGNECTESLEAMVCAKELTFEAKMDDKKFGIKPFLIDCGPPNILTERQLFTYSAPTTCSNTLRILRGLQLNKAILLEGNPGVGKTSLVTALAKSSGNKVVRINLSDQTDITDLFGTDLPSEDGSFTFKEGMFLNALQNGDWILLDELNLAPQPVLEGLNAVLDHRGEIFIPELGKTFKVKHQTKLFACQNPLKHGGARRGLPVSFLNRFTQVYIDTLTKEDLLHIVRAQYLQLPSDILEKIVEFNCKVAYEVTETQSWGHKGSPWEMNLRDIQRWCEAMINDKRCGKDISSAKYVEILYVNRMRTEEDKDRMTRMYDDIFGKEYPRSDTNPQFTVDNEEIIIGDVSLHKNKDTVSRNRNSMKTNLLVLRNQLPILKALAQSVKMNWLSILVGPTATGKSSIVQVLADLTGNNLHVVPVTSAMDVSDLLGGFEQVDYNRNLENLFDEIETITIHIVRNVWIEQESKQWKYNNLLGNLYKYKSFLSNPLDKNLKNEDIKIFEDKVQFLSAHCERLFECAKLFNLSTVNLEKVKNYLAKLKNKVSKLTSVNIGGKFEWVDSLLVKTLVEGSWLLLDNVNLTSAAVLDRLNGLLEPNGVLCVPERGEISDIVPHPNFRIFFTMDPKYGEISRAMRNRGVEIFLLRPDDCDLGLSETVDYLDLVALLSSCGLPNEYHDICIRCHETMSAFIQGLERPTISHLLQAGHLTWQQLIRGIASKTALLSSFSDVYIKPRNGSDFVSSVTTSLAEMKNAMLKSLEVELEEEEYEPIVTNDIRHTLTVKGLCSNSANEIAKQITYPLIKQAMDLEIDSENIDNLLFCTLTSFQKCPPQLLDVINFILKNDITMNNSNKLKALTCQLNDKAYEYLKNESCEMYKRFLPETYKLNSEANSEMNTKFVLFYIELKNIVTKLFMSNDTFSAIDYSSAVTDGKLTDDFTEYPILKNCKSYLIVIDNYIKTTIKSAQSCMNDNLVCLIIQLLNWRDRLIQVCSLPIFEKSKNKRRPILKEEIVPLLNVHNKWILKYLLGELFKLHSNQRSLDKFTDDIKRMKLYNDESNSSTAKVSKKLRKCYGQPKLYRNQNDYELCKIKAELDSKIHLDMNKPIDRQYDKIKANPMSLSDFSLALDVPEGEILKVMRDIINKTPEISTGVDQLITQMKLLPLNLYVIQRIINILLPHLQVIVNSLTEDPCRGISVNDSHIEVLLNVIQIGNVLKGFPPALLNQLKVIEKILEGTVDISQRISSIRVTIWTEIYNFLTSSPVTYPLPFLKQNVLLNLDDAETIPANTKRVSLNLPVMNYYVQNFTTFADNSDSHPILSYERVSLKDRVEYSLQLSLLLNVLWKNIGTLDLSSTLKLKSDSTFERQKCQQLIKFVKNIVSERKCGVKNSSDSTDTSTKSLQLYFKDDSLLCDMLSKMNETQEMLSLVDFKNLNDSSSTIQAKILTSQLSLLTSIIFIRIISEINPIDHVEKYRLKMQYIEDDVKMFDRLLSAYYIHGIISGTISEKRNIEKASQVTQDFYKEGGENREKLKKVHPYCSVIMELKEKTTQKVLKYSSGNSFRPKEPTYGNFVKECKHFTKSVISEKTLVSIYTNLTSTANILHADIEKNRHDKTTLQNAQTVIKETSSWLHSMKAFNKKVDATYALAFPDLAKPLQSSLSQIIYSVTSLVDIIRELTVKIEKGPILQNTLTTLLEYPYDIPNIDANEKHLNRFISANFMKFLKRNVVAGGEDTFQSEVKCFEMLKMNLLELSMHCMASERIDKVSNNAILTTLNALVKVWEKQREEIERKKQDEEALYVTKSKCEDEDEEAVASEEIMEMFPSYSDSDFVDFKPPTLEQKKIKAPKEKPKHLITSDDVSFIYKWHSKLNRDMTSAEWLASPKKLIGNDVVSPLLARYPTFSSIAQEAWEALDADFEGRISPSLLVLLSHIKEKVDGIDVSNQKVDFYHSPWVSETRECLPLLQKVKLSTNKLLNEWPDFPTLKDIIVIVDRILGFPITSPVSRFLTGLELLRDKIEEWNKNAHKGNNMIDISLAVGQQIVNWRKLEMSHWKECLNNLYQRKQSEAHKYWFYVYAVIESYLDPGANESVSYGRIISVLKDFMEMSNLAEFEVRLDIVYVYHCHLVHFEYSERRDELLSILWNTYNYYAQFSPQITTIIKEKRAPIEKKLRDFVKICSWDRDLSYWSVKDTVDKAHKVLHKHTKEFERLLKESVESYLVDNASEVGADHVGIWDRPKRATGANVPTGGAYMIDPLNHIVQTRHIKKYLDQAEQDCPIIEEGCLLSKVSSLLNKAKVLCKDTITNTGYPALVQTLDDFVTLVIETYAHLGSLEVDTTATKDKQKSQAKNIVQQKRKALADLFKYLAKMGLNYRTGLVIVAASEELYDFTIPPVDLDAAMSYLKSRRCDHTLTLWSGCETYFQKNIARHRRLNAALQSPHTDLGLQNIERCTGFAAQLLKMTSNQKKSISKYTRYICDLRTVTTSLTNALDADICGSNISTLKEKLKILDACYARSSILLDQLSIVLKSIPENTLNTDSVPEFDIVLSDSPIARCFRDSNEWRELYKNVKSIISTVDKQKTALYKVLNFIPKRIGDDIDLPILSQAHIEVTNDARKNLALIMHKSEAILQEYQFKLKTDIVDNYTPQHPILRSVNNLVTHLRNTMSELNTLDVQSDQEMSGASYANIITQAEDITASMLLIIQSLYKRHLPEDHNTDNTDNIDVLNAIDEIIDEGKEKEASKEIIEDKHLKELLHEKISGDIKLLQLDTLIRKIRSLLFNYMEFITTRIEIHELKMVVMRMIPILEQTILFVQYFVSQKVAVHRVSCKMLSVLLKIFSDLAKKGFCKPSDLDMEEADGEGGPGKLSSGTGLGEGEGQKDVSEKIEDQDQLDDARRPSEEKKEEDRDCKEEEKGVNMTDDFDSHLQDVEQKEGEDPDDEDDNEDADKQMGETDNAAEKLDQQIWGSEDEEDLDEDSTRKEKDEHGKGESTGEKEMTAKEKEQGQDDGTEGKEKQKQKDINEINEPEVDDDHVDPYHGNQQQFPEPEDFELPDNMDVDGDQEDNEKEGETETENPFEIDMLKEPLQEETEEKEEKGNKNGLEVSSDEEDDDKNEDTNNEQNKDEINEKEDETANDKDSEEKIDDTAEKEKDENAELDNENLEKEPNEIQEDEESFKEEENLMKNPNDISEEEDLQEKQHEPNSQANPSNNDPTAEDKAENAEMDRGTNDNVQTNAEQAKDEDAAPFEQAQEQVGEDKQSTGRSELDKSDKGHRGDKQAAREESCRDNQKRFENKPGKTDQERTLGDVNEKKNKKAHTLNVEEEDGDLEDGKTNDNQDQEADAYQHIKQAKKNDIQVVDAATKEQADQQPTLQKDEDEDAEKLKEDKEVPMEVDDEDIQVDKAKEFKPEKLGHGQEKEKDKSGDKNEGGEEASGETGIEVEGDAVLTANVSRGRDTTYHTRLEETSQHVDDITMEQYMGLREWLVSGAAKEGETSAAVWRSAWRDCSGAARALCERLRLVLEPTGRSRRAGDFRTGRAINMRRVIPYIASHFRKDRIWLRRSKPAAREYRIAIAVDDSSSMADNRTRELAFESLALVSQALNLLESGDLAVLSYGEKPNLLHPFTEQFSEHSGAKILEQLRFDQTKTRIAQLLDFCTVMFDQLSMKSDALNAKLLLIVSDGRGIFSEGETKVVQAVRRARQQGIFLVYVIVDNPDNKDSIMDIRRPVLDPVTNSLTGFVPYLDTFPFPFYLILRDMNALPTVLGDALRQWFELAANAAS